MATPAQVLLVLGGLWSGGGKGVVWNPAHFSLNLSLSGC